MRINLDLAICAYYAVLMTDWRDHLPELLEEQRLATQGAIVRAVAARTGVRLNQATVSRELNKLGARKMDGAYRIPTRQVVKPPIYMLRRTANDCLIVLQTDPAFASVLGNLVDRSRLPGVLGTIAGDDTVFVATTGPDALGPLTELIGWTEEDRRRSA